MPGARPGADAPELPLGLAVRELDRGFAGRLAIPETVEGVIVSRVDPTGTAFSSALRRGFVIMEINRKPVRSVADYQRMVAAAKPATCSRCTASTPRARQRAIVTVAFE